MTGKMTDEHKRQLAMGRAAGPAIRNYLAVVSQPKRRGRKAAPPEQQIATLERQIKDATDPIERVKLVSALRQQRELASQGAEASVDELESGFVQFASWFSEQHSITYADWREMGVPPTVLKRAGIKR